LLEITRLFSHLPKLELLQAADSESAVEQGRDFKLSMIYFEMIEMGISKA
jgi:hypothetical protein